MQRRAFLGLVAAAIAPTSTRAQKDPGRRRLGFLVTANPQPNWDDLRDGLRDLGYIDGQGIQFEFRSADGNVDRLPELAAELVRLDVDVLVVWQTPAALAARRATSTIPIVMAGVADPVGSGIVASLARPGGNVTGVSGATLETSSKLLELIGEMLPSARRIGLLANAADPFSKALVERIEQSGRSLSLSILIKFVRGASEIAAALSGMKDEAAEAVLVQPSLPFGTVVEFASKLGLPSASPVRSFPIAGGLMSYSADQSHSFRQAASYVDRILKGASPAELPVAQPTRYSLLINLKTAGALGIVVPPALLARTDEVIE
jgi:putative ABC transport system substrate-binding protein